MSLTEAQIAQIKNLINDQMYFNAENGAATNFTLQEKVSYALKLALQRVTTDAFATGKEWYTEPDIFNPVFKNQIYSKPIPRYGEVSAYYCVVKFKGKKYITNITVNTIFTNLANSNLIDILDNTTQVLPPENADTSTSYEDSRTPISADFNADGLLTKLPRSSWAFFNYWKKYLTGTKSKNNIDDSTPTNTAGTGTYPNVNEKSTVLTVIGNTVNAAKNYSNLNNNAGLLDAFLDYTPLEIIPNTVVDTYISENGSLDQINTDYSELLKNTNDSVNINMGISTYSTWSGVPIANITNVNNSQYSDNMGFYNPLLPFSLGERYGYNSRDAGDGYYMISSNTDKTNITASFGQGGDVKEGTMIFSADTGFILFFGIGNVITGVFNGVTSPISVSQPPIISCFKYVGGTFDDGIINNGAINPLPINSSVGDIFINTTDDILYLLKENSGTKEWVALGGSTSIEQGTELPDTSGLEGGELFITTDDNKLYRFDGTQWVVLSGGGGGGGGLFKAVSDASATELVVSQTQEDPKSGDLYFNTTDSRFNYYAEETSAVDKWVPIALARLSGQPPPLLDVSVNATTAYIEVRWRNPKQIATSMTSDLVYTDTNSPASAGNWLHQNMIYFPIVNRFVLKLTKVDSENNPIQNQGESTIQAYPMYLDTEGTAITSVIDTDGYVVFRKGDILSTDDTDENTYNSGSIDSVPENNLLEHMPTGLRIYKSVPVQADRNAIDVSDGVILPFSSTVAGNTLNANFNRYRIDVWMENNSPDTQLMPVTVFGEYFIAPLPELPREVTLQFGQNSGGSVNSAVTQCVIETIDPSFVAGTDNSQDGIVNFSELFFEWSIDNFVDTSYTFVKIRAKDSVNDAKTAEYTSSSERQLTNGIMSLNRPVDSDRRFYTFDITQAFLGTGYSQIDFTNPVELSVRVSYKNSSNPDFGGTLSSSLFFGKPSKHTIHNARAGIFNSKNQFQIQLSAFSDRQTIFDDIGDRTETLSTNTNYALFIKDVQLRTEYEIDGGNIVRLSDTTFLFSKTSAPNNQNSVSSYFIDIPTGLPSGVYGTTSIKWRFQIRVRNNLLNGYSDWSDIAGTTDEIDSTQVNAIEFVGINTNNTVNDNTITSIAYQTDNDLTIAWSHPASNDRGIHTTTKTVASYPKVYNYDVSFARADVTTNRIEVGTNRSSSRTTDSTNSVELSVFDLIDKNGVSTNSIGSGRTDIVKTITAEVLQRNEFVSTYSRIARDFFYLLEDPNNPTQHTASHSISSNSALNKLDVQWTKPAYQGFKTGLTSTPSNTTIEINQYRVNILADRANSDSPFYRDQFETSQSLNDIIVSAGNRVSEARTTIVSGTNDLHRTSAIPTGYTGDRTNVLVYPETQYKVTVKSRNIFNIEGDSSLNMTITTGTPISVRAKMASGNIPLHATIDNVNNVSKYAYNGFILAGTPDNSTPSTGNQITNVNGLTNYSASQTHLMNGVKFNTFLGKDTYVTNVSAIKLRRFVLKNMADGTQVYAYGSNTNQFQEVGESTAPIASMFSITTPNNEDVYEPANNRDGHNRGYWWEETFQWTLNFANRPTFGVPILLQFQVRYNNKLSSAEYAGSSIENGGTYDEITRNIMVNTANTNSYAYFDDLNANPGIQKRGTTDYITLVSTNNQINGIPNLYPMGTVGGVSMGYQYKLNYELTNYSEYYGVTQSVNFTRHRIQSGSTVVKDNIENRSWSTKTDCERSSNRWTITDLMITQDDIGTTNTGEYSDVRMYTYATNTRGSTNVQLQDSGNLYRFIYDEATVTTFKNVFSSLRNVPTNYNPFYAGVDDTATTGDDNTEPSLFNAYSGNSNNLQMSMWNGRFYSNKGWRTATGITTTNCLEYGIPPVLPVFTNDTNYSWTIFKYQYTNTGSNLGFFKGVISLGENTNITLADLANDNVVVFILNINNGTAVSMPSNDTVPGVNTRVTYYWLKACNGKNTIGNSNGLDDTGTVAATAFYNNDIADTNLRVSTETSFLNGGTIPGFTGNSLTVSNFDNQKRIYGFRFNKYTLFTDNTAECYVSIGIKNNIDKYISKPRVWLLTANTTAGIREFT